MVRLLAASGVAVESEHGRSAVLRARAEPCLDLPAALARCMRASILVLGALVARHGRCSIVLPGGCAIGKRPIDWHLEVLRALGAFCVEDSDRVVVTAPRRGLSGGRLALSFPSVGATEQALLTASCCRGESVIENAAREPEIQALASLLGSMGAEISGAGERTIRVQGRSVLGGGSFRVPPDRIEVGTLAIAVAASCGRVVLRGGARHHLGGVAPALERSGVHVEEFVDQAGMGEEASAGAAGSRSRVRVRVQVRVLLQAPFSVLMSRAEWSSSLDSLRAMSVLLRCRW